MIAGVGAGDAGVATTRAIRTIAVGAGSARRRCAQWRNALTLMPRPAQNTAAVCPLARHAATRPRHVAASAIAATVHSRVLRWKEAIHAADTFVPMRAENRSREVRALAAAELLIAGALSQPRGGRGRLLREPERGADAGFENGVGLSAVGGCTRELQRPGKEPQERRGVRAGHLVASTR